MLFNCLLSIVLLSPLPFGASRPWSWSLLALFVGFLAISWAITTFKNHESEISLNPFKSITDVMVVFMLVLGWAVYQAVVPVTLHELPSLWALSKEALKTEIRPLIALTPDDAIAATMRFLSYGLTFCLSFYYCQAREKAKAVFFALMTAGFIYSLYGLVIYFGNYGVSLWIENQAALSAVTSTFLSPHNFAIFAGLTLLCTCALLSEEIIETRFKYQYAEHLGWPFSLKDDLSIRTWLTVFAFVVISIAVMLTFFRYGFFSSLVALCVFLTALHLNARIRNYYTLWLSDTVWIVVIFIAIGTLLFNVTDSHDALIAQIRNKTFAFTWAGIVDRPWSGLGLGSFAALYQNYSFPSGLATVAWQDYAHNMYLELLFELGIPASLAVCYCFFRLAWICLKGVCIRKKDWIYPAAGLSATVLVAVSAFFDFSMQIPAIVYTYALLMGAACGQSSSTRTTIAIPEPDSTEDTTKNSKFIMSHR